MLDNNTGADWQLLCDRIREGVDLRDSLRDLAAKLIESRMDENAAADLLRAQLASSTAACDPQHLDDLMAEIPDLVMREVKRVNASAVGPLPFINIGAWQGQPVPSQEWLVLNRIPHENVTLLSGDGATGKTTILLQLGVGVVHTGEWLGATVEHGPVIFYTGEEPEKELHRRLAAILAGRGLEFNDIAHDFHAHCRPADDPMLGAPDRNGIIRPTPTFLRLQQAVRDIHPRLVAIEAAADVFGGDENKRPQVRQFIGMLRGELAIKCATAVVLLQHPSMAGLASGTGTSGSTHWSNSCRSRLYLATVRADQDSEPDRDLRKLEVMKSNYGPPGEIIKVRWKAGAFVVEGGTSGLDKLAHEAKVDETFMILMQRMLDQQQELGPNKGPSYAPAKLAQHEAAAGITSREFTKAMQRLIDAGKIHIVVSGPPSKRRSSLAMGASSADVVTLVPKKQQRFRVIEACLPETVCLQCQTADGSVMRIKDTAQAGAQSETLHEACAEKWFAREGEKS